MDDPDPDSSASLRVTASLGPAGPLLRQLRSLATRPEGVSKGDIRSLIKDLEELCVSLMDHSEVEEPSSRTKSWMSEIRELCYDTKNYLDDASFISKQEDDAQLTLKEKKKNSQLKFKTLKSRASHARKRRKRYEIDRRNINSAKFLSELGRRLPVLHAELIDYSRMDTLANMLGTAEEKPLKAVSLVGVEGVGKTTLAKRIYYRTGGQFQCRAFVRVSPNPDMRRLLTSIFTQIQQPGFSDGVSQPACCLDAQHLIENIKHYLQDKRYLIIIDDLWSISVWDIIRRAFPDDGRGSRIITTTQIEDVASACCSYHPKYMFQMKPLENDQSRKLFFSIVFGCEDHVGCSEDYVRVSDGIISKCGGLPLLILNVTSLLPTPSEQNLQQWMAIRDSLPSTMRTNTISERMKQGLHLVYNNLSSELKTCLLYLAVYPEGYTINKDDLVKQWVAEGFTGEGQNKEETAREYFDELLSRGMIQAVDINYGEVRSCTLHHMVHDLVVKKSMEGNFIIGVDYSQSAIWLPNKVRRLSAQFGGARNARLPAGITLSEVRSLAFFGFYGCADFIEKCKLLRVLSLHVWADDCVHRSEEEERPGISPSGEKEVLTYDLSGINKSLSLRYLKVACNVAVKLPDKIEALQYLETLEVDDATVVAIPSDIGRLSRLSTLKIAVRELSRQYIYILQALPALSALSLHIWAKPVEMIIFVKGEFLVLKHFKFSCPVPWIKFEAGSMPDLRNLNLCFNAHEADRRGIVPIGIKHLPGLKEIIAEIWGADTDVGFTFRTAISNHPSNPRIEVRLVDSRIFQGEDEKKQAADSSMSRLPRSKWMSALLESSSPVTVQGIEAAREGSGQDENNKVNIRVHMQPESSRIPIPACHMEEEPEDQPFISEIISIPSESESTDDGHSSSQVVVRGSKLSMLSATESLQAPVAFRSVGLASTPPAVNTQASGSGASQVTGMAAGFGGHAGFDSFSSGAWPGASSSGTAQGFRPRSNQLRRMGDANVLESILDEAEDPMNMPLALLRDITNDFSKERRIGHGKFGVVYKGVLGERIVAVKRIHINENTIDDKSFRREVTSLMKINHQNVVRFLGFCSNTHWESIKHPESGEKVLVNVFERLVCLEYISNGSLDKHITDELGGLEWETRYKIIMGICKGLYYLHSNISIVHLNLTPAHILLDDHMVPKITNFGLSRTNSHTMAEPIGTREYLAPEYREDGKTTPACDIYSLGVIIIELVTGCKDIPNKNNVLRRWSRRWKKPPTQLQYQQVTTCIHIAGLCRTQKPKDRPSISELIIFLKESASTYGMISPSLDEDNMLVPEDISSSFSCHYPTNKIFPRKESDRAVDLTRGAMGSLLHKLGKLITVDYNLEKSIKRDIVSFSKDLTIMHQDLANLAKLKKLDGANILADEVRELSYNIEDMIDNFLVHFEPHSNWINDVIRDIKNQVQAVAYKKKMYHFDFTVVDNKTSKAAIDNFQEVIYQDKEELIGIEAQRDEVIRLFGEDGNLTKQNLKIVSIVGHGGLGKTTLAKVVYEKLQAQYHHRAFVSVGQNPNVKEVLKKIIYAFKEDFNAENLVVWQLCHKLEEFLKNKRYFIVIDDIWDSSDWKSIRSAFPENKCGSRVITTTRIIYVALACCNSESKYVYRIKPLSEEDSKRLFFRRTFGPEIDYSETINRITVDILKTCGGMPLAINSTASLLAGQPRSTWEYLWKSLGSLSEGKTAGLENMMQILDLSYIHLPDHLKTCLLYVCMYRDDREIDKHDLLRQWVAEGFVSTVRGLDAEDVAEYYFNELIDMCLIQPGKIDYNNEVLSCRVHGIILDLLRSTSAEENFIQVIDCSEGLTRARGQIRRVSVHYNDKEDSSNLATIKGSLEHVRSVLLHQASLVPYFLTFKYIRVLHIEDDGYSMDLDLTGISRLFLLNYLKIACFSEPAYELKLPNHIGELQQLETLDIDGVILKNYPSDIVSLPRLSHLSYGGLGGIVLPDGIDKMKSLRTLGGVCVYKSSVENIKGLGELTNLRKLQICPKERNQTKEVITTHMNALHSSISRLSARLKILTVGEGSSTKLDVQSWNRPLFPGGSHIQKLDLRCCEFKSCPKWIGHLQDLYSLSITVREVADGLNIVGGLPSLVYFYLEICSESEEQKEESCVVISGGVAFKALKHLSLYCQKVKLTFEVGAMPMLEKLELEFCYHMTLQFLPAGIEYLPVSTLKEICLTVARNDMEVKGSQDWGKDDWKRYYASQIQHISTVWSMLKKAFMEHHPGADIKNFFDNF